MHKTSENKLDINKHMNKSLNLNNEDYNNKNKKINVVNLTVIYTACD